MTWYYLILASIIEGITEFVPISSTGHLIILNHLLKIPSSPLISSFNLFIQLGAILAVVSLYYQELIAKPKKIINILVSFAPAAIIGFIFYPLIKNNFLDNLPLTVFSLFFGGLVILLIPRLSKIETKENLSYMDSIKIGLFQALSIVPGTSRALTSILGGLFVGLSLKESVKYSFLLAIPTIAAATIFDLSKNFSLLLDHKEHLNYFIIGFLVSFVVAKLTLKLFLKTIKNPKNLIYFGYYRISIAILILVLKYLPL